MKVQLIDGWQKFYKLWSFWVFVLMGCAPEIYSVLVESGLITGEQVPALFAKLITSISVIGIISRVVKQKALEVKAQQDSDAQAA